MQASVQLNALPQLQEQTIPISKLLSGSAKVADELLHKQQCQGFAPPQRAQLPPLHPASSKQPNFIYLLVDDMGYDDLALHHPTGGMHAWLRTANMDRLVRQGLELTNFYTTPMCSTSRAELLTGRFYPRTGSFYINSGWDFMNTNEATMGRVFSAAGYKTVQLGKVHAV
ncbi:hypothetical protein OEZ85_004766 [Tetradesmus obliquus]|uniref:Sulfatase N-terminal domain-containing protein n=1 Tax=Tetradesmus obliquus TaxID=3088 RepID=A0ABY8UM60_TETOB|nr:hypothetical protein OEZ85_004766 [Tetradesmus obliquus]